MSQPALLRSRAEALAGALPPLLAEAEHLAMTVLMGEHGRRRSGLGDEFWQYRPATPGDETRNIDWRRSARSDQHFVREKEWQAAQSVQIWVDTSQSMQFAGAKNGASKGDRARLIALSLAVLLVRGGERVGLAGLDLPPRRGELQLLRIADAISRTDAATDYGAAEARAMLPHSRAFYVSDFLGDLGTLREALAKASDRGIRGALLQVLDPHEERFPFDGRTIFESMAGKVQHETLKARDLRGRYLQRLAERKAELSALASMAGWHFSTHHTGDIAQSALLWAYRALERNR